MRFHRSVLAVTVLAFGMLAFAPAATANHWVGPFGVGDTCYWVAKDGNVWITGYHYRKEYGPPEANSCDPHDPCYDPWDCPSPTRLI